MALLLPPSSPQSEHTSTPRDPSDPYGFFALERRLKQRRADGNSRPVLADISYKFGIPPTPSTPHRHRPKRPILSSHGSEDSYSAPSTPSPTKPPVKKPNALKSFSTPLLESSPPPPLPQPRRSQRRRTQKMRKLDSNVSVAVPQPTRHAAQKSRAAESQPPVQPVAQNKQKKAAKAKAPVRRSRRLTENSRNKKTLGDVNSDEREKLERERQERLEYFKNLDDYQIAKENVYVV